MSPGEEDAHDAICTAKVVACPAADVGCTVTVCRKDLDGHTQTCQLASQRSILLQLQALTRENEQLKGENQQLRDENRKHSRVQALVRIIIRD